MDTISIILLISLFQGLFLLVAFLLKKPFRKYPLIFLLVLIAFLSWYQIEFFLIRNVQDVPFPLLYGTRFGSWYVIGPLIWLYTRAFLDQTSFTFRWRHALHFLPFFIFALLIPAFFYESILSWRSVGYGMLTVFDPFNEDLTAWNYAYGSIFIGQFLHAFVYTAFSYRFVRQQEAEARELTSSLHISSFSWLKRFQLINLIVLVGVGIFVYYLFETRIYRRQMDYFFALPMAISTYTYSLLAFLNPQQLWAGHLPESREKYQKSSLSHKHSRELVEGVVSIMETQKPYLNSDLKLADLAGILSISPHHLSQVINENLQLNFYDFINQYRVKEAKILIEQEPETNLLQIGIAAGFNNKNSFNNAFKKHMGLTPSSYRKEIHQK